MNPQEDVSAAPVALRWEAGPGGGDHATHGSIEAILEKAGFKKEQVRAIYYGNWLRDYSQLLDPKIVRATSMPKNFPDVLSREALTKIVDVLAVREFTTLMQTDRASFIVTEQRLGVYRPREHIDNPKAVNPKPADPKSRDPDFEDWTLTGDPVLQVDFDSSMKRYLQRSVEEMTDGINTALYLGPESNDGLRALGSALHVLEDFFAHSNFVELSLRKLGHSEVLPWTSKADCRHGLPLVTGSFGGSDIIASLANPLGKMLFSDKDKPFEATRPGVRYERDQIVQILLSEHPDPKWLEAYELFLSARDTWAGLPFAELVEKVYYLLGQPGKILGNALGTVMQGLATWFGNSVDDYQTQFGDDPNTSGSTDPTHSQLAKDHAEHPLHLLAAALAEQAVLQVGQALLGKWYGKDGVADPSQLAAQFFSHPMDTDWQDHIVREWAEKNPRQVKRATVKSEMDRTHQQLYKSAVDGLETFKQQSETFLRMFSSSLSLSDLWKLLTGK